MFVCQKIWVGNSIEVRFYVAKIRKPQNLITDKKSNPRHFITIGLKETRRDKKLQKLKNYD